jgi:aminoglycoside N3'-acetyltransferase
MDGAGAILSPGRASPAGRGGHAAAPTIDHPRSVTSTEQLVSDLRRLGVGRGDHLMVHASLRAIGPVGGGAGAVLRALEHAVGADGTLLMVLGARGVPEWREEPSAATAAEALASAAPFDAERDAADPEVGWLAEVFRTTPGTLVTDHPLGRFGAWGRLAPWLLRDAPWHDYYGPGSPLDHLCAAGGRVLRLGADLNTVTLLHRAEYLAPLENKRRIRRYVAVSGPDGPRIRHVDALDDSEGIVPWEGEDYFALLLSDYLATGRAARGRVGNAHSELLDANDLSDFAVRWMRDHLADAPAP